MRVIDLSTLSLVGGSGIAEAKILLWSADGTYASFSATSSGTQFIQDGSTGTSSGTTSTSKILTLSSNWPASLQFAFEPTLYSTNNYHANASLWDFTGGSLVSNSSVYTSNNTATVVRSSAFTLTPGHSYGVTVWTSSSGQTPYIVDASLIIFP